MRACIAIFALTSLAASSEGIAFSPRVVFGVRGGSEKKDKSASPDDDYERAEKAVLNAITTVEDKVQKLVSDEVDILFHKQEHYPKEKTDDLTLKAKKADVALKAKKAVEKGARKAKKAVDDHAGQYVYPFEEHPYPYAYPQINNKRKPHEHKDHRILHAVEAAEKAVLHAIQEEVDTIFHEVEHNDEHKKEADVQAKHTVKEGVKKASGKVEDHHKHRRRWLSNDEDSLIEEYATFFLE